MRLKTERRRRVILAKCVYDSDGLQEQNARLIAVAPLMLETVKGFIEWFKHEEGPTQNHGFFEKLLSNAFSVLDAVKTNE